MCQSLFFNNVADIVISVDARFSAAKGTTLSAVATLFLNTANFTEVQVL